MQLKDTFKVIGHRQLMVLLLIILATTAYWVLCYSGILFNNYIINDDQPHNTAWMYTYYNANTFYGSDNIMHFTEKVQPLGYRFIFSILSLYINPLVSTKILVLPLLILSNVFLFLFLSKHFNAILSLTAILLILPLGALVGLHARAFAYPFLFALLYFYSLKQHKVVYVLCILSFLFYPAACIIFNITYVLSELITYIKYKKANTINILFYVVSIVVILSLGLFKSNTLKNDLAIGNIYTKQAMLQEPEFGENGSYNIKKEIKQPHLIIVKACVKTFKKITPVKYGRLKDKVVFKKILRFYHSKAGLFFILSVVVLLVIMVFRKQIYVWDNFTQLTTYLLIAGIGLYFLACLFPNFLYIPYKYLRYTVHVSVVFYLLSGISKYNIRIHYIALIYALLVVSVKTKKDKGYIDYSENEKLYGFFENCPPKSIIAGPMDVCNQIPIISNRSVMFSKETSNIMFKGYWESQKQKIADYYHILFAQSASDLENYIQKYQVDYIIIDFSYYTEDKIEEFEPIKSIIIDLKKKNEGILLFEQMRESKILVPVGNKTFVLDCNKYKR